jgi:putative redox protein
MGAPVIVRSQGAIRVDIESGAHKFIADEPVASGGSDLGPTPYDFMSAALGACTSMTLHIIAKRENIPLESLELRISNDRMYAKDCEDCLTASGYIHRFRIEIKLEGAGLTDAHRQRLLEIAKRCPVNKTLCNEIKIDEVLV